MRILIAEDHPSAVCALCLWMEEWGFKFDLVPTGERVLQQLLVADYDLIIMNVVMPVMDGIEATRKIRKELDETLPIIAFSGHPAITREKCIQAGMDEYIEKGIGFDEPLHEAITRLTRKTFIVCVETGAHNVKKKMNLEANERKAIREGLRTIVLESKGTVVDFIVHKNLPKKIFSKAVQSGSILSWTSNEESS